ncbi:MAG: hypothetical protein IT384_17630 [Deltaproteobacteria bacterium]|nr:hypothetical protein [Deltaproteobacteria bacterium]
MGWFLALGACSTDPTALRFEANVPADVAASRPRLEARFFVTHTCDDLALRGGALDLARTATAVIQMAATTGDGFAPVSLEAYGGALALDVRAVDSRGTPLAQRCVTVDAGTAEIGFVLARFAPEGARVELREDTALLAGSARQDAVVWVADSAGAPVDNAFVSSGAARPLAATDDAGLARVGTPTDTPSFDGPLPLSVYGLGELVLDAHASALAVPSCPEVGWSRELVIGLAGARTEIAVAGAFVVVAHPRSATTSAGLLEILTPDPGGPGLLALATATTSAVGSLATLQSGDDLWIAQLEGERGVRIRRFDALGRRWLESAMLTAPRRAGAPLSEARGLALRSIAAQVEVFAAGIGLLGGVVHARGDAAGFADFAPAIGSTELDVDGLLLTRSRDGDAALLATGAGAIALFVERGAGFEAAGRVEIAGARLVPSSRFVALALAIDGETGRLDTLDVGASGLEVVGSTVLSAPPAGGSAGELNRDRAGDLLVVSRRASELGLVVGDGRGRFIEAVQCPLDGGPAIIADLPDDASGRSRWITVLESEGRLALLTQER